MQIQTAQEKRRQISAHLQELLGKDGVLMLPTAPGPAPTINTPPAELDLFRSRLLSLTCIAGLGGLPQVLLLFKYSYIICLYVFFIFYPFYFILYLTVSGVEPVMTHQTSWLESTGLGCGATCDSASTHRDELF